LSKLLHQRSLDISVAYTLAQQFIDILAAK